jgi:hypothetical protein
MMRSFMYKFTPDLNPSNYSFFPPELQLFEWGVCY